MIPGTRMIRPEDNDERVPLLRRRLAISGELRGRPSEPVRLRLFDDDLEAAVRRFQENNGLRVTGRVDKRDAAGAQCVRRRRAWRSCEINLQRLRT